MSYTSRFCLLRSCPLLAMLMLGCGTDNDTDEIGSDAGSPAQDGGGQSSGGAGGGSAFSDAGSSAGGGGSTDGATGAPVGATDAGRDSATVTNDASSSVPDSGGVKDAGSVVDASGLPKFSFFVTSEAAIVALSKNSEGFGGDLSYGEMGSGAGLRGADKICAEIAEMSMEGASAKQWRAFLSASTGGTSGGALNARDRIGDGPWYDRNERLVSENLTNLLSGTRPGGANAQIVNDLPNETGTPNHSPNGSGSTVDNHDTLTGSDKSGRYVSGANTCQDWTTVSAAGGAKGPMIGHSWPRSVTPGVGGQPGVASEMGGHWVSDHNAGGCGRGIDTSAGTSNGTSTVGSGGGYGGFYCFALTP